MPYDPQYPDQTDGTANVSFLATAGVAPAANLAAHPGQGEAAKLPLTCGSVLVIEDDAPIARMISANLRKANYCVSIASSGQQARECLEQELPDLILSDVCLGDMDGIELTRWVRARFAGANLPIALMTSSDDRQILSRGLEAGADDFLTKPVSMLELRSRVATLLRAKMAADEIRAREQTARSFGEHDRPRQLGAINDLAAKAPPVVVVVEDDPAERRLLERHLSQLNCTAYGAGTASEGLALIHQHHPDLVVLDLLLPDQCGYEFIAKVKSNPESARLPILVVSALSEVADRVKALEVGAEDFIVKGFETTEFGARVRRLLRLKHSLDRLNDRCQEALQLAVTDSLTGLYTHGFLQEILQRQLGQAQRYGTSLSIIFADLDRFKDVNDRRGHAVGDAVLRTVASLLRKIVRPSDTLVRYGGEEFVILLPHTAAHEARALAERMREYLAAQLIPVEQGEPLRVTMSMGVASFPDDAHDAESLIERGDGAMYRAKQAGRNRVVACGEESGEFKRPATILLADDDEKCRRLLQVYLTREGYEVVLAADGSEALEIAQRQPPDILILDALMPKLSGFEACRHLKQDPRTKLLPVILISTLDSREDRLRGIEAGADEMISKPLDKAELLLRVRALVRQKRGTDMLEDAESVIFALARAIEGRNALLRDHADRVVLYSLSLGRALSLPPDQLNALRRAAIVHDVGKIVIPDSILLKPGKLTAEEWQVVRQHPEVAYRLLQPLRTFAESLPAVRFHHERLDGSGYPLGLRGANVPLLAQILAIADVFDALTAPRCYRQPMSCEEAVATLRDEANRGLHDPRLIETFIRDVVPRLPHTSTAESHQPEPVASA